MYRNSVGYCSYRLQNCILFIAAIVGIAEGCTFWDDDVEVDIEAIRPNNFLRCSMNSLAALREAVMRPGAEDVIDESDGLADMLRDAWKGWRVISASRDYVLPTQPIHVSCALHMECQSEGGCGDVLFLLPYHEAMQTSGITSRSLPTLTELDVEVLKGIHDVSRHCCHNFLKVYWDASLLDTQVDGCRGACYPALYRITLPDVLPLGGSTKLRVDYYIGKPFSPLQPSLELSKQQRVAFGTSSLFQCPYHTTVQRTYFSLLEELNIEILSLHAYTKVSEIKENVFLSGPYEKIELLSFGEELVIAINVRDGLEFIPTMHKNVRIPMWPLSNFMRVYENYVVYNDASPLEGAFCRATMRDLELNANKRETSINYVGYMEALFPLEAKRLKYYDVIGNIDKAYENKESPLPNYKSVDLLPRFPLLGGWKTTFTLEYRLPYAMREGLHENANRNANMIKEAASWGRNAIMLRVFHTMYEWLLRYVYGRETAVTVPLYPAVFYMYIHEAAVYISLPPGSRVSRVSSPPYTRFEVNTLSRKLLGATVTVQEVTIYAGRLALQNMDAYVGDHVEVVYTTSMLWMVKVLGILAFHVAIGYTLSVALNR